MKEKLLRGEWTGVAPLGYSYGHIGGNRKIIAGEKGKLIARAFEMKGEGLTNTAIASKLDKLGLRLDKERLSDLFSLNAILLKRRTMILQTVRSTHRQTLLPS